ncbi:MAG: hypothetical protein JSS05_09960 [Proteobacteria bacterium]|nr:hypothetical protein [Pseudomonadota bacterium]
MSLAGFVAVAGESFGRPPGVADHFAGFFRRFDRDAPTVGRLDGFDYAMCNLAIGRGRAGAVTPLTRDGLVLLFDGWLENSAELAAENGWADREDASIVLAAFSRWGDGAWAHLYGEYSFLLWDAATRTLLAVRDKVGVRPIYFAATSDGVIVGNLPGAVAAHPRFSPHVNLGYAAEFLCAEESTVTETLYAGIQRLPGGHVLRWQHGHGVTVQRYWRPRPRVRRHDVAEATSKCRSLVQHAVAAATRGASFVGCELSGGIDSSSVAVVLARLVEAGDRPAADTTALSLVYPGLSCDETPYIAAVASALPYPAVQLQARYASLRECETATSLLRYPYFPFNASGANPIIDYVRERGGVLLTGEGGDELFEPTEHALRHALCRASDWTALHRLMRLRWESRGTTRSVLGTVRYIVEPLAGLRLYNAINRWRDRPRAPEEWPIDEVWMRESRLRKRLDRRLYPSNGRTLAMGSALNGVWSPPFEWMFMMSCVTGVEARHPLASAALIEFGNSLPLSFLDGQDARNRLVLRRAGADELPPIVLERTSKAEFTPATLPALIDRANAQRQQQVIAPHEDRVRHRFRAVVTGARHIWRLDAALAFELWLRQIPASSVGAFHCEFE